MLLYQLLKLIVSIALRVFYRRFEVHRWEVLRTQKSPLIVAVNHPNTFMDPLIVATLVKQRVAFIANGSIFNRFTRPFFRYMHVIPVYRKKDTSDVKLSPADLNRMTFQQCYDYLAQKGSLMIFPEGTSEIERRLRDIKTGTARIALGAEYEHGFDVGVRIIPVGLNYSEPTHFRTDVFVNIGEPITVADWKNEYQPDNFEAVESLTHTLHQKLSELVIITEDDDEDSVVRQVEMLYKNQLFEELALNPHNPKEEFDLIKQIVKAVRYLEHQRPELFKKVQIKMINYLENLQKLGLSDQMLLESKRWLGHFSTTLLLLIVGLPLYLFGLLNNYLPYILPSKIARWITSDITYRAPLMMSAGILLFPVFYGAQIWVVQYFFQQGWLTFMYAILLPLSGFFVLWYWDIAQRLARVWRSLRLFQKKPSLIKTLQQERQALFQLLEDAKNDYLISLN